MSIYVLVHGAWHGSWYWERFASLLRQRGHHVVAVDLPGRAGDPAPHHGITLAAHAAKVCKVVASQSEPVILMGHSMGGTVISETAEHCPEGVRTLVYVSAFLLRSGQSLSDVAQADHESLVGPNLLVDEKAGSAILKPDTPFRDLFYGSCAEAEAIRAQSRLVPEPLPPMGTPVRTTAERFGRIPRVYVECLRDRAILPSVQRQMVSAVGCDRVFTMDTDHSPFLSDPISLTAHLTAL